MIQDFNDHTYGGLVPFLIAHQEELGGDSDEIYEYQNYVAYKLS